MGVATSVPFLSSDNSKLHHELTMEGRLTRGTTSFGGIGVGISLF
jgi:hypothetical protein